MSDLSQYVRYYVKGNTIQFGSDLPQQIPGFTWIKFNATGQSSLNQTQDVWILFKTSDLQISESTITFIDPSHLSQSEVVGFYPITILQSDLTEVTLTISQENLIIGRPIQSRSRDWFQSNWIDWTQPGKSIIIHVQPTLGNEME